jgi:glycosyltransferase involved in cell wall biosynthesis
VLTFHDMQHEYFPELFSAKELDRRRREYRSSVEQAQAVIAISQHVKECLVDRYEVDAARIHVVHHGCSGRFKRIADPQRLAAAVEKYALRRPFMIYPAASWAHKNHLRLLRALQMLVERGRFDGELLLTGAAMDFHGQVLGEIGRLGLQRQVRWLGYLPEEDLPCLFTLARLMVFPSLFEGFGLPVLEAMACGCPVGVARPTALPEVAGDAAVYFDPHDAEDIAATLLELWESETLLEQLARCGLQRAAGFGWQKAASQTIEVYRQASRGRAG